MFVVASHIISTYTGSYTQFVKERIFDPLNMTSTTFSLSEAVNSGKMSQNWASQGNGRRIPHWMNDGVAHMMAGSGGIISSVVDVVRVVFFICTMLSDDVIQAKWVEVLLNSGFHTHSNTTIIPKSAFDQITSAQVVAGGAPGPVVGYCAGWLRETFLGHDVSSSFTPHILPCKTIFLDRLAQWRDSGGSCATRLPPRRWRGPYRALEYRWQISSCC